VLFSLYHNRLGIRLYRNGWVLELSNRLGLDCHRTGWVLLGTLCTRNCSECTQPAHNLKRRKTSIVPRRKLERKRKLEKNFAVGVIPPKNLVSRKKMHTGIWTLCENFTSIGKDTLELQASEILTQCNGWPNGLSIFSRKIGLKRQFLALAPKGWPLAEKCPGQTLFVLAQAIVW